MIKTDNISYLNSEYDKNKRRKIVFMDRDGTIHIDKVETHLISDLEFFPDTVLFMQKVTSLGYDIIVITNQSGIGKGHYDIETMKEFNFHIVKELEKYGEHMKLTDKILKMMQDTSDFDREVLTKLREIDDIIPVVDNEYVYNGHITNINIEDNTIALEVD